ncbi:MAG: hypothetical protein IPM98_05760 [Lewinellaceae bacterium]|nr:hypothetical protein [Lewinellaceae bacterium]
MTQERFLRYLKNPDLLATISYEELKTLALIYPFAHNLRYLLAIKAGQDKHPDFSRNRATAAAYSLDRTRLLMLVAPKELIPKFVEQEELVLELKPIEAVQRELEAKAPVARPEARPVARAAEAETPVSSSARDTQRITEPQGIFPKEVEQKEISAVRSKTPGAGIAPSFGAWMSRFNPPALVTPLAERGFAEKKSEEDREDEDSAATPAQTQTETTAAPSAGATSQTLAERSVVESKTIVSETLARLYVQQGYREKAIQMYERLCLAFPDKSAYFAAEIEKLKK